MDVLIQSIHFVFVVILALLPVAHADPNDLSPTQEKAVKDIESQLCKSTDEYIKTIKFLRENKQLFYPEQAARLIAHQVSKGCTGAAERFAEIIILLKKIGLSEKKSLEISLEFAAQDPDVQKNFIEVFTRAFLTEFYDYDFNEAVKIAIELSRDYKGDAVQARKDFIELVHFCKDGKNLDLPNRLCAEFSVRIAHLSQYFRGGVRQPFHSLYNQLRTSKEFSLDVKSALEITYHVLKNGPTAPENFFSAFKFATEKDGLSLDKNKSIEFALNLADRSHIGPKPPIFPVIKGPRLPNENESTGPK